MLHIISSLPISPSFLDNANSGDTVIFTGNAIFAVKQNNLGTEKTLTQKAFSHINLCVRKADLLRQLETNNPPTLLAFLSVLGFVATVT